MRNLSAKISLIILTGILISACDTTKRVPNGKRLLISADISVNNEKEKSDDISNLLYQEPNSAILGFPLRLNLYNLAPSNPDSLYKAKFINNPGKYKRMSKLLSKKQVDRLGESFWYSGFPNFLKRTGEPPVILDSLSTNKSLQRLRGYYYNQGFFNAKVTAETDSISDKKAGVKYDVITGTPYILDSLTQSISTPVLDSIFQANKSKTLLIGGKQYNTSDFEAEKNRVTTLFRNNGIFHFQQNYVHFDIDTVDTNYKANSNMIIDRYTYRENDSTKVGEFIKFKISEVNIFTDIASGKSRNAIRDSTTYKNVNLYSATKLKYRSKALTDAVFITKGTTFADFRTTLTSRYLSNLRVFNYPSIQYVPDTRDSTGHSLITNIYLSPRKKYSFGAGLDVTHSNIQDFGIAANTSVTIRNIFNGAETLEISGRGTIGSSRQLANPNDNFFNVSEYGLDAKLNFPRILMPFNTDRIIPKNMIPSTSFSVGFAKQQNIGLDKENFTTALTYNWTPKRFSTARFDLFNVQYVKNVNIDNYFRVYGSSYDALNLIAQNYTFNPNYFDGTSLIPETGTLGVISDVQNGLVVVNNNDQQTINSIEERRLRLTENNLIIATSYTFSKTTKTDLLDNTFFTFKTKVESAGNVASLIAAAAKQLKNDNGSNTLFQIEYSQYIKTEFDFIKHWDLRRKRVLAMRLFTGIAIPYGNSNSIPFSRSYFGGGSNDNRAWRPYGLGPGASGAINDFNEANMKLAFSTELRFNLFGDLYGAVFTDIGNIWNVLDNVTDEKSKFVGLKSLKNTAIGTGFGARYDFSFFVIRLDLGFKTYNPAEEEGNRWFRTYNFANSVLNIGINYPF